MEKWIRRYYRLLLAGLLGFAVITVILGKHGASKPILIFCYILFYLAYKNGLQHWTKNQAAMEDPEYQAKRDQERLQNREVWKAYLLPRTPWYRNESIAVAVLLILAFLFRFR